MADGSIVFSTELDNKELERQLVKVKREIEKLERSTAEQEAEKSPLVQQAQELEQRLKAARAAAERYGDEWAAGVAGADKNQTAALHSVQQLELQHAKVAHQIDKVDAKLLPACEKLDEMKKEAGGLQQKIGKAGASSKKMASAMEKAQKSANRFALRLREVVRSALIFTVITQSLASLRDWIGKVVKTNAEATEALSRLKGALLTLAQPLVEVVIPAFSAFANALADIVGMVASMVSAMFGSTVEESAEAAEKLEEEQEALEGVGKSAEKAGKSLANFDEINKLSGDTASESSTDKIKPDFSDVGDTNWLEERLGDAAGLVTAALLLGGIALVAIGAAMGSLPLVLAGLVLIGSGVALGAATGVLQSWVDALGLNNVREFVVVAVMLGGIALVAIGAALGNILLVLAGLGLIWGAIAYAKSSGMMDSWTEEQMSRAATYITAALILGGIVLIAIGAATGNILMVLAGLALLAAGVYVGVKSGTLKAWAEVLGLDTVFDYVVVAIQLVGIALIAIGAAMGNVAMIIAGAAIFSVGLAAELIGEETLKSWWEVLKLTTVQQWVGVALLLVGLALVAIGAAMANIMMIIAGAVMLGLGAIVSLQNNNLEDWVTTLGLEKIVGWVTAVLLLAGMAFIVFGIVTVNVLMVIAGAGMLVAGLVVGAGSGTFKKWWDALGLNEVTGWVATALLLGGIALVAIGAMTLNPVMLIAGLALLGVGIGITAGSAIKKKVTSVNTDRAVLATAAASTITANNIPALASGAVIPANREFLAVLGDQKSGTNIEAPVSEIEAAVARGIAQAGGGRGDAPLEVNLILDNTRIGRVLLPSIEQASKARGVRLAVRGTV